MVLDGHVISCIHAHMHMHVYTHMCTHAQLVMNRWMQERSCSLRLVSHTAMHDR